MKESCPLSLKWTRLLLKKLYSFVLKASEKIRVSFENADREITQSMGQVLPLTSLGHAVHINQANQTHLNPHQPLPDSNSQVAPINAFPKWFSTRYTKARSLLPPIRPQVGQVPLTQWRISAHRPRWGTLRRTSQEHNGRRRHARLCGHNLHPIFLTVRSDRGYP